MNLHPIDIAIFVAFIVAVVGIGIFTSRHEKDSESYFLAGRGLSWWLIGFSLIAANISTEQFVGMSGNAADRSDIVAPAGQLGGLAVIHGRSVHLQRIGAARSPAGQGDPGCYEQHGEQDSKGQYRSQ